MELYLDIQSKTAHGNLIYTLKILAIEQRECSFDEGEKGSYRGRFRRPI